MAKGGRVGSRSWDTFWGLAENPCAFGTLVVSRPLTGVSAVWAAISR